MDEDQRLFNERQSIRESARSLKKYGSTCNHLKRQETLIKHEISKTDTLQGIALKYGISTEQIRRANRLFASDSLFLRENLMIPVTKDSPFYPKDLAASDVNKVTHRASIAGIPNKNPDFSPGSPEERKSMDDFLVKIDTSIATMKKHVAQSQQNSNFVDPMDSYMRRSSSNSSSYYQSGSSSSGNYSGSELNNTVPHAVVMTQGRKVRTSLQRLQQQQDEIFEL